jgi:hypothetical protein
MDKVGNWLQIGANIGIVIGLILVAGQIYQNSELGRLNFYFTEEDANISIGAMPAGDDLAQAMAKAVDAPESLTTTEMIQLDGYLTNIITQLNRRDYLYEAGIYQTPTKEFFAMYSWVFGNKFALAWWSERRMFVANVRVRVLLDQEIEKNRPNGQALAFENIQKSLAAK